MDLPTAKGETALHKLAQSWKDSKMLPNGKGMRTCLLFGPAFCSRGYRGGRERPSSVGCELRWNGLDSAR